MCFGMPANIIRAYILDKNPNDFLKHILSGIVSGWKSIWRFVTSGFVPTDEVIPEMPFKLYDERERAQMQTLASQRREQIERRRERQERLKDEK